jgi:hypothetical protein
MLVELLLEKAHRDGPQIEATAQALAVLHDLDLGRARNRHQTIIGADAANRQHRRPVLAARPLVDALRREPGVDRQALQGEARAGLVLPGAAEQFGQTRPNLGPARIAVQD